MTKVELTRKGTALFERIFPDHARFIRDTFAVLSPAEQKRLGDLLRKLGRHLAAHGVCPETES